MVSKLNRAHNDENQLVAVWVVNVWSNSFAYDGMMRKRIEQDFAWNGGGWTETNEVHYVYDGKLVLQERDKNNQPLTTYTRGIDLSGSFQGADGSGGLLARSDNQRIVPAMLSPENANPANLTTSYYFSDFDGNVVALVSPSGMLLAQYEYDPFGNLILKSGMMADINRYRYSSKEWEGDAGLYYYGYRFYDPNLQRWLNRDPISEAGGINLYDFVVNSPLDYFDLLGLDEHPTGGWPLLSNTTFDGPTDGPLPIVGPIIPPPDPNKPWPISPIGGPVTNIPPVQLQPKTSAPITSKIKTPRVMPTTFTEKKGSKICRFYGGKYSKDW